MLGANRAMLAMIKDLRERYHVESTVLMPAVEDGNLAEVLEKEGFPYLIEPMKMWVMPLNAKHEWLRSISAQIKTFFLSKSILKKIKNEHFDLIYTNNSTVQYGAVIARKRHLPHVWHIREFGRYHYDYDYSFPYRKRLRYFSETDQVVAISDAIAEYAKKELCPGADIKRVYDGIAISKQQRIEWNRSMPLRIVYVAALQSGKNQLELIKAAEKLWDQGIKDFEIHLVGDGAEYRAELEMYVAQHRLSDCIQFHGYRDDVEQMLDTMDVGVICSKAEGFGLVTCEYMAASMPVAGADSGATPELIEDGETGFIYKPGDVRMLAEHLKKWIENRELMEQMGKKAYRRVQDHFTLQRHSDEMYAVFEKCLKKRG